MARRPCVVPDLLSRHEAAAWRELPRREHVASLPRTVASPPPRARIARIRTTRLVLFATVPPTTPRVAVGTAADARTAGRAMKYVACLGSPSHEKRQHDRDEPADCAGMITHAACIGPHAPGSSVPEGQRLTIIRKCPTFTRAARRARDTRGHSNPTTNPGASPAARAPATAACRRGLPGPDAPRAPRPGRRKPRTQTRWPCRP